MEVINVLLAMIPFCAMMVVFRSISATASFCVRVAACLIAEAILDRLESFSCVVWSTTVRLLDMGYSFFSFSFCCFLGFASLGFLVLNTLK